MRTLVNSLTTAAVIISVVFSSMAQVNFTERAGGDNGTNFMLPSARYDVLSTKQITGIAIQYGRRVENIVLQYSNNENENKTESAGNNAGNWSYFELAKGEYIVYITGRAGTLIDQVSFHTSMRRTFGPYGGSGGQEFELTIPSNAVVIGFTGKTGPSIKQLGLIYRIMNEGKDYTVNNKRIVRDHRTKKSALKGKSSDDYAPGDIYEVELTAGSSIYHPDSIGVMVAPIPDQVIVNKTGGIMPPHISGNKQQKDSTTSVAAKRPNRNPNTGKVIQLAAKNLVKIKPGKDLSDAID